MYSLILTRDSDRDIKDKLCTETLLEGVESKEIKVYLIVICRSYEHLKYILGIYCTINPTYIGIMYVQAILTLSRSAAL